jgi:RHS repeat-associated protein
MFLHQDWLGNDRIVSSTANHTEVADRAYAPYGEQYNTSGSTNPIYGIFAENSGDFDSGILFDTPNRELASAQGRWISPDPAGVGWNQYAYATNPNSFVDPSGLFACDIYPGPTSRCYFAGGDPFSGFGGDDISWGSVFGAYDISPYSVDIIATVGADAGNTYYASEIDGGPMDPMDQYGNGSYNGELAYSQSSGWQVWDASVQTPTGQGEWEDASNSQDLQLGELTGIDLNLGLGAENPYVTFATDAADIFAAITDRTPLGVASAAWSSWNNPSTFNITKEAIGLIPVPEVAVPISFLTIDADILNLEIQIAGEGMIEAIPADTIDNGNGLLVPSPSAADPCQWFGGCP